MEDSLNLQRLLGPDGVHKGIPAFDPASAAAAAAQQSQTIRRTVQAAFTTSSSTVNSYLPPRTPLSSERGPADPFKIGAPPKSNFESFFTAAKYLDARQSIIDIINASIDADVDNAQTPTAAAAAGTKTLTEKMVVAAASHFEWKIKKWSDTKSVRPESPSVSFLHGI